VSGPDEDSSSASTVEAPPARARRHLGIRHLWLMLPLIAVGFRATFPIGDNSFLWHVRAGQLQLETGEVLRTDPFSFTFAGEPWRTQSWLLELGYGAMANATGGIGWTSVMIFLVASLTLAFVALAAYQWTRDPGRVVVIVAMLTWVGFFFFVPRPVLTSFALLAVTAVMLQHHERVGWAIVPMMWLWAAVHGSFPVGLGLVVLEAVRRRSRRLGELALIGTMVTLLTAHGIGTWEIVLQFLRSREALSYLSEWARPDFLDPLLAPFLLLAALIVYGLARRRIAFGHLIVILPFVVFAGLAERSVFPAMVVLAPYAAAGLGTRSGAVRATPPGQARLNWVFAALMGVLVVVAMARPVPLNGDKFPPSVALQSLEPGNVFHGPAVGGVMIYELWPERRVFVDDRAELYGAEGFAAVVDSWEATRHREVFAEHAITQVIVKQDQALASALRNEDWDVRYEDETWLVLARPP
jgi:nitrogen fixation-related uncharacterized protein